MAFRNMPEKKYRLRNGDWGTEYEMLMEMIRDWEALRQQVEDRVEELRYRLNLAEGRPSG